MLCKLCGILLKISFLSLFVIFLILSIESMLSIFNFFANFFASAVVIFLFILVSFSSVTHLCFQRVRECSFRVSLMYLIVLIMFACGIPAFFSNFICAFVIIPDHIGIGLSIFIMISTISPCCFSLSDLLPSLL